MRNLPKFLLIFSLCLPIVFSAKANENVVARSLIERLNLCAWLLQPPQQVRSSIEIEILENLKRAVGSNVQNYAQGRLLITETADSTKPYESLLSDGAVAHIRTNLTAEDVWVDGGAGNFGAMWEYFQLKQGVPAKRIGIIPEISRPENYLNELLQKDPQFIPLLGLTIEEADMIPSGKVTVITDVFGAFAYSKRPDLVLRQYLRWLKKGGVIYLAQRPGSGFGLAEHIHLEEDETYEMAWSYLILDKLYLEKWLSGGSGFSFSFDEDVRKLKIVKEQDEFSLPELVPVYFHTDKPPLRIFAVSDRKLGS